MALTALNRTNYADFFINALLSIGSTDITAKRLSGSRLTVELRQSGVVRRYRVLLFAVSGSGRGNPEERRVEITSTYAGGNLEPCPGHSDVIVGVDRIGRKCVGIDARRLQFGGASHNASTFVYLPAFDLASSSEYFVLTNDRQSLFPKEYQIYFRPSFAWSYLNEISSLHRSGLRQTPQSQVKDETADKLDELAANGSKFRLTYEQQVELALKKMEIGRSGEAFVLQQERLRLVKDGRADLADLVEWTSQSHPYVGYDIRTFNSSGEVEFIEVKSSSGQMRTFFISQNELKAAKKYKETLSHCLRFQCVDSCNNAEFE